MDGFAGFEPQVGEIRAVRSFRIDARGALYPLFKDGEPWVDGANVARCALPSSRHGHVEPHRAPAVDCTCGFYAYGTEAAALEYPNARYVLAVVACWGQVIAGTRGLRAGCARIEALWLSDAVPLELGLLVAARYPGVETYGDRSAMLREHAPSRLECYEAPPAPEPRRAVLARRGLVVAGLVLGLAPRSLVEHDTGVLTSWLVVMGLLVLSGVMAIGGLAGRRRADPDVARRLTWLVALALWMFSAFAGLAGTLVLRLPLIQLALVIVLHRRRADRLARRFPARIEVRRP